MCAIKRLIIIVWERSRTILLAFAAFSFAATASAGGTVNGAQITNLYINAAYTMVFVTVNLSIGGGPSCSAYTNQFVLPLTSTLSNQTLALLISARTTASTVNLGGNGQCDTYPDVETLQTINY